MPRRIQEDHKHFRDVVGGRTRKELKRLMKTGGFIKNRPDGGRMRVNVTGIEQPRFVHGDNGKTAIGRGEGDEGDVVGYEPGEGDGGNQAGDQHVDGITVGIDLDDFLQILRDELQLPEMKPKPNQTYEEIKIRYNDISRIGPDSLRHTRRTMLEAAKRLAAQGELQQLHMLPGCTVPMPLITPINADKRFRQYQEEKIPSSNAVIFFIRDCSGSMDDFRCDVVSDMSWWIDLWIKQYYERMERCYIVHDSEAEEVSKEKFYGYRGGGGTRCSSGFQMVAEILENRFPPDQYNIYIFYFSDGDNWGGGDNQKIIELMNNELGPEIVNMIGFTEICPYGSWGGEGTLKEYLDNQLSVNDHLATKPGFEHVRTALIGNENERANWGEIPLADEDRDTQIIDAIKAIIGREREYKVS